MVLLLEIISRLIYLIYKALFLKGDYGLKKTHILIRISISISLLILYWLNGYFILLALLLVYLIGLLGFGREWVIPVSILTSIPSIWFSISTYVLSVIGYIQPVNYTNLLWIFIKSLTLGSIITLFFNMINVTELYNILLSIKLNNFSIIPLLIWRITPLSLMSTYESLLISRIKGEKIGKRIAPALAVILETGDLIYESSYYKLAGKPKKKIPINSVWLSIHLDRNRKCCFRR